MRSQQNSCLWYVKGDRCALGMLSNTADWRLHFLTTLVEKLERLMIEFWTQVRRSQHLLLHRPVWASRSFLPLDELSESSELQLAAPQDGLDEWQPSQMCYWSIPSSNTPGWQHYPAKIIGTTEEGLHYQLPPSLSPVTSMTTSCIAGDIVHAMVGRSAQQGLL